MRKLIKIAPSLVTGALGLAAVWVASPASAYYGDCYKDTYGNCYYAPLSLATERDSPADMAAWGDTPDQHFAYWVTHDDDAPEFRIIDFSTLKAQGLWACQLLTSGMQNTDVLDALQDKGEYTDDEASDVHASAVAAYCPSVE
jgi:hypothetical protein